MKIVFSFLFLFAIQAKAQSWNPMCPGNSARWINNFLMKVSSEDEHPYSEACEPVNLETGEILSAKSNSEKNLLNVYMRSLPQKTKSGKSVNAFMENVKKKIQKRIDQERKKGKQIQVCLTSKTPDQCIPINDETKRSLVPECGMEKIGNEYACELMLDSESKTFFEDRLNCSRERLKCTKENASVLKNYNFSRLVKDARYNLVLATPPGGFLAKNPGPVGALNGTMKSFGVYKEKKWDMSVGPELVEARQGLDSYFDQARKNLGEKYDPNNRKHNLAVQKSVFEARHQNFNTYMTLLANNPILQFMESENPSKMEVMGAVSDMLKSLDKEEKWLNETTESLGSETLDNDLLKLMNYKTEVTSALAEMPDFCGISREFKQLHGAKSLGKDIAITTPILFGSVFLPVLSAPARVALGATLGVGTIGTSAVLVGERQIELDEAAYQVKGRFDPKNTKELEELNQHLSNRKLEMYFGALGVIELKGIHMYAKTLSRKQIRSFFTRK